MTAKKLKKQLFVTIISLLMSFVALASSTYAWYVTNNRVSAGSTTISAKTDNFVLQVATLEEGAQHGDNQSLVASLVGHRISPSSTNDLTTWFASLNWGQDGLVHSYMQVDVDDSGEYSSDVTGTYTVSPSRYAFIKSEYVIYTVSRTGYCDVYLASDGDTPAIQVTASESVLSDVIPKSMRVGITIQDLEGTSPVGEETLVLVYAPYDETGKGNDGTGINGWTYVVDETNVAEVTYPHVYGTNYIWTDSGNVQHNFAATKNGSIFEKPANNASVIASDVDYEGKIMRVYIWLEGTDEQCVNNSKEEDPSTYSVTVSLAGVSK